MIIIAEKINSTRKAVAKAVRERDAAFILILDLRWKLDCCNNRPVMQRKEAT